MSGRFSLEGRVAVVTGASRGLGRAIALGLAEAGADLVLASRTQAALEQVAAEIEALGRRALPVAADVSRAEDVQRLAEATRGAFGRADVLVNNAGISPVFKRAEQLELADWQRILDVNLTGVFLCCQAFGRIMLEQGRGAVINMSSLAGSAGFIRLSAYCASKGGVDALTRVLALEWAPSGIRVNALAPAFIETDLTAGVRAHPGLNQAIVQRTPLHRMGVPDEVVGAAVFLASDAASYVTGQTLFIDGGWRAS